METDLAQLRTAVLGLEGRLRSLGDPEAQALILAYEDLLRRITEFEAERDELFARRGALMLIEELLKRERPAPTG